jgi:t-SNARE complex subunit (syntaxin)
VNEKNIFYYFVIGLILFACSMATGCRSQPNVAGSTILQSAEDIGRLKEQNRQLTELTDDLITGIESIESRIDNIQNGIESAQSDAFGAEQDIDRAIELFIEYKSRIDKFLDDYRSLQNQIKNSH